jgi:hypothetical protein
LWGNRKSCFDEARRGRILIAPLAVPLSLLPWLTSGYFGSGMGADGDRDRGIGELRGHSFTKLSHRATDRFAAQRAAGS